MTISLSIVFLVSYFLYEVMAVYAAIWLSKMTDNKKLINNYIIASIDQGFINKLNNSPVLTPQMEQEINKLKANQTAALDEAASIRRFYLWWYLGFGGIQSVFVLAYSVAFTFMVAFASRYIHMSMIGKKCHDASCFNTVDLLFMGHIYSISHNLIQDYYISTYFRVVYSCTKSYFSNYTHALSE